MTSPWQVLALDDVEHRRGWLPLRELLDVKAYGINAWSVESAGDPVIPEHHEKESGHEELYVVTRGHATFTVDGDELDGPAGTILFVRDPALSRSAVALEADTVVLSVGARVGQAFEPLAWEWNARAFQPFREGDYETALAGFAEGKRLFPNDWTLTYNMACASALLGRRDDAIAYLRDALELGAGGEIDPLADDDFSSLRDDAEFVALVASF